MKIVSRTIAIGCVRFHWTYETTQINRQGRLLAWLPFGTGTAVGMAGIRSTELLASMRIRNSTLSSSLRCI